MTYDPKKNTGASENESLKIFFHQLRGKNLGEIIMMIIMKSGYVQAELDHVIEHIREQGLTPHLSVGAEHTVIGAIGDTHSIPTDTFEVLDGVESVMRISQPYKLASRQFKPQNSVFSIGEGVNVGGNEIIIIGGPCSVESRPQLLETADAVYAAGGNALRGGVFKPRTSPYVFQGLGEEGLQYLVEARKKTGMPIVAEIMSQTQLDMMVKYVDVFQVGA